MGARRGVCFATVASLLLAGANAAARRPAFDEKTYAAAAAAWKACFPETGSVTRFPPRPDPEDSWMSLDVRRTDRGFHVTESVWGSSVESTYGTLTIEFEPQGCRALWANRYGADGALGARAEVGWKNRDPPTDGERRALIAEPARPDDARHAFARAWLLHRCPGGPGSWLDWKRDVEGPIAPQQPAHEGRPLQPPSTFWSTAALAAIGARDALHRFNPDADEEEENDRWPGPTVALAGVFVPDAGKPIPTFRAGSFQLYEARIPGRNDGRAIAVFDRTTNEHRWAVVTRGCVQGTTVRWLGAIDDRIVGVTRSRHGQYAEGDAILVIDAPSATAWAIRFPEAIRTAIDETNAAPRASLAGSRLTMWVARAKATIELAPLLARIPPAR